jgi:hypothetical protein
VGLANGDGGMASGVFIFLGFFYFIFLLVLFFSRVGIVALSCFRAIAIARWPICA